LSQVSLKLVIYLGIIVLALMPTF